VFPIVIGIVVALVGLYLIAHWWVQAEPRQIIAALRWGAIAIGIGVVVFAAVTRRWGLLAMLAAPALMLFRSMRAVQTHGRNAQGPSQGRASGVETRYLRMWLDHDSGTMDGEVTEGPLAGRQLSDLTLGELIGLWRDCVAGDEQSRTVLEAWLDRVHGATWRQAAGAGPASDEHPGAAGGGGVMDAAEAREILGVGESADRSEIEAAYRRAMQRAHPDHGGTDALAARINEARDLLLKR
jgi:hypothetical protein